ncbi:MAG: hypothetical protein AAGD14_01460 [Planctomycetota bacterium]
MRWIVAGMMAAVAALLIWFATGDEDDRAGVVRTEGTRARSETSAPRTTLRQADGAAALPSKQNPATARNEALVIQTVREDGTPAPNIRVRGRAGDFVMRGTTDGNGALTLRPPDQRGMRIEFRPGPGIPYQFVQDWSLARPDPVRIVVGQVVTVRVRVLLDGEPYMPEGLRALGRHVGKPRVSRSSGEAEVRAYVAPGTSPTPAIPFVVSSPGYRMQTRQTGPLEYEIELEYAGLVELRVRGERHQAQSASVSRIEEGGALRMAGLTRGLWSFEKGAHVQRLSLSPGRYALSFGGGGPPIRIIEVTPKRAPAVVEIDLAELRRVWILLKDGERTVQRTDHDTLEFLDENGHVVGTLTARHQQFFLYPKGRGLRVRPRLAGARPAGGHDVIEVDGSATQVEIPVIPFPRARFRWISGPKGVALWQLTLKLRREGEQRVSTVQGRGEKNGYSFPFPEPGTYDIVIYQSETVLAVRSSVDLEAGASFGDVRPDDTRQLAFKLEGFQEQEHVLLNVVHAGTGMTILSTMHAGGPQVHTLKRLPTSRLELIFFQQKRRWKRVVTSTQNETIVIRRDGR